MERQGRLTVLGNCLLHVLECKGWGLAEVLPVCKRVATLVKENLSKMPMKEEAVGSCLIITDANKESSISFESSRSKPDEYANSKDPVRHPYGRWR